MPYPRPPYLQREVTRTDKTVWYVRRERHGRRIRLKAEYGSEEFWQQYQDALSGQVRQRAKASAGSLAWLVERYRETSAWTDLSLATRRQRENILRPVLEKAGTQSASKITRAHIAEGRDRRTKSQGRHFIDAMRGLFEWAAEAQHVKTDPTAGVKYPKQPKTDGFVPWNEEDVAAYEKRWPIGTRQRVWLTVLLWTGLRRGDAVLVGRQHVRNDEISIENEKTGMKVTVPIAPELDAILKAGPCGDLHFVVGSDEQPMKKESFGNAFGDACRAAGVPGSAHGLRKLAAIRLALAGATIPQMNAIFGWTGSKMAMHYIDMADRAALARDGMRKLRAEREVNKSAPAFRESKGQNG
jgi:integrase